MGSSGKALATQHAQAPAKRRASAGALLFACVLHVVAGAVIDFEAVGGVPDDASEAACWKNGGLVNSTLGKLQPGDTFVFPNKTFHLMGGIMAKDLHSVTISFDGTLVYSDNIKDWPRNHGSGDDDDNSRKAQVLACMDFANFTNVSFTSSGKALIDGKGARWWGIPGIGYLLRSGMY